MMIANRVVVADLQTVAQLVGLLADLDAAGVLEMKTEGEKVLWRPKDAVGPDLLERIKGNKQLLLAGLQGRLAVRGLAAKSGDNGDVAFVTPGTACPVCGSLTKWWDLLGGKHCQTCHGALLERSLNLADRAARLRRLSP